MHVLLEAALVQEPLSERIHLPAQQEKRAVAEVDKRVGDNDRIIRIQPWNKLGLLFEHPLPEGM